MKIRGIAAFAAFWTTVAILLFSGRAGATVHSFTTADIGVIPGTLQTLAAGDEVVFAAGTYIFAGQVSIIAPGTAGSPVSIHAAPGAAVIFQQSDANHNLFEVKSSSYLTISGLELAPNAAATGALPLRIQSSSHVTISNCNIHGFIGGITANLPGDTTTTDLSIVHNEIHDLTLGTDEGIYAGCAAKGCAISGTIEGNWIHDTSESTGGALGTGIEVKEGSTFTIRDNVVSDVQGRCILAPGGGSSPNVIERNACVRALSDNGIEVNGDATIRNNIVIDSGARAIYLSSNPSPGVASDNIVVQSNTIVSSSGGIQAPGITGTVGIYDNAIYSDTGVAISVAGTLTNLTVSGNLGVGTTSGISSGFSATGNLTNDFVGVAYDASSLNAYPKAGSALIASADSAHMATDDYNASIRGTHYDVGAYLYSASGNPGQTIAAGFKTLPAPPETDAGTDGGATDGGVVLTDGGSKDGGASGSDASLGGDSGGATTTRDDAGSNGSTGGSSDDSGCGCTVGPATDGAGYAAITMLVGLAAVTRSRRRSRANARSEK